MATRRISRREFVCASARSLLVTGMLAGAACDEDEPARPPMDLDEVFSDELAGSWRREWLSLRYETPLQTFKDVAALEVVPAVRDALDDAHYMAYPAIVTSVQAEDVEVGGEVLISDAAQAGLMARCSLDESYALLLSGSQLLLCRYAPAERVVLNSAPLPGEGWASLTLTVSGGRVLGIAERGSDRVAVDGHDTEPLGPGYVGLLATPLSDEVGGQGLFRRFRVAASGRAGPEHPLFAYRFAGAVAPATTGFEASVTARTVVPQPLAFEVSEDPRFARKRRTPSLDPRGELKAVHAKLEDLEGGREYFWRPVATGPQGDVFGPVARLRTPPSKGMPVRFVFASCTAGGQARYPSFLTARAIDPDFYLHAGDWGYVDGFALRKSADHFQAWWIRMLRAPGIARLLDTTPLMFWQDDHDYDADFGWAETVNPVAVRAFDELHANPSDEFFDVRWGDVHVWCLDCRKYASDPRQPDGPGKTRIGAAQKQWLKEGMLSSDAPVRLVATSMVFRNKKDAEPGWHNVYAHERDELLEFFSNVNATVAILSGDAHGQRLIHHWEFGEIYEINSSGTDFTGNGESGNYDPHHTLVNLGESNGFAVVELGPSGPGRILTVRVVARDNGSTLFKKDLPVDARSR